MKKNIDKFFKWENNKIYFNSNSLVAYAPIFYKNSDFYIEGKIISILGILKLEINNKINSVLCISNYIESDPSKIETDNKYIKLYYKKGDVFINNTSILQLDLTNSLFTSFIMYGKIPDFFDYQHVHKLFDNSKRINNIAINVGKEILEVIYSYMYRNPKDLTEQYRYTNMKDKPSIIGLTNITYAPESTTAKLLGSYLDDGITGALITKKPKTDSIEQILSK